jgi:peroxiredoxin
VIEVGQPAPQFRAPSSTGQTLETGSFGDHIAKVLFFLDSLGQADDQIEIQAFDELLVEFGHRRVQLLGVAPATAREVRDATTSLAVPILADEDSTMRKEFGGLDLLPFTVVVDRHNTVVDVLERRGTEHPNDVLRAVDALQQEEPEAMRASINEDAANKERRTLT